MLAGSTPAPQVPPTVATGPGDAAASMAPTPLAAPAADTEFSPEPQAGAAPEPGKGLMRVLMALFGLCLIGLFVVPWDGEHFFWQQKLAGLGFVFRLFLAAGGVVFLAGAAIPIPYVLRGLVAFLLGTTPLALDKVIELKGASSFGLEQIMGLVLLCMLVLLPAALFHRWRVYGTVLGRILVLLGVLGLLAVLLVPRGDAIPDSMPLVKTFLGLGDISGVVQAVTAMLPFVLLVFAVMSLLALLPRRSSGGTAIWALGLLLFFAAEALHGPALALIKGADFWKSAPALFTGIYLSLCLILASYGLSQVLTRMSGSPDA